MTTERTYEALLFEFGHDPATLKQTFKILNDPLPEHVLMGQELFQALYQAGIPWAELYRVDLHTGDRLMDPDGDRLPSEPISPDQVAKYPEEWRVHFNVTGLEATYQVLGVQTYDPYAVQLELKSWSTK